MKHEKKLLSAAITLSLVLGVYGVAGATDLYGSTDSSSTVEGVTNNSSTIGVKKTETMNTVTDATTTASDFTVTSGTWGVIRGGYSNSYAVQHNDVTISGGTIKGTKIPGGAAHDNYITGGFAEGHDAHDNTLTISGDTIISNDDMTLEVMGGYGNHGNANNNTLTISGGTFNGPTDAPKLYGGKGNSGGQANENTVTISGGSINATYIYGGYGIGAANNKVYISGGTIELYCSTNIDIAGGVSYYDVGKPATNNEVNISGGTITGDVYGGFFSGSGTVSNNKVTVSGGAITGNVYGGRSTGGAVTGNTVTISGTANLTNANLYGYNDEADSHSGNTLTVESDWTGSVKSINNFDSVTNNGTWILAEKSKDIGALNSTGTLGFKAVGNTATSATISGNLNFYIPASAKSGDTMLTVNGTADLTGANVAAGVQTGSKLKKGDTITLIDAQSITGTPASTKTMTEAGYNKYELGIDVVNNKDLVATVLKGGASENAKSPLETMAASMSMLNMGGDMLATEGLESAVAAANAGNAQSEVFAAIGNSNARVNSGSHVDVNGTTFNLGFAKAIANESGKLVIGPVVEYGTGSYDSYLDNGYHGDGKSKYWGVGLVAKQLNDTGVYYEGSLRGGKVTNDYSAADGSFDSSALYIAAHLGLGKVFQLNEKNNVDVYGKYFFTHQGGDNVVIDGNEFDFKNANSNRARLGARYNYNINAKNTLYGGLAWQYEFSGEAAGSMGEDSIEAPSLKGHTGILELGWKVAPTKTFEMKLGMSAYTGVERGGSASVKLNWKF